MKKTMCLSVGFALSCCVLFSLCGCKPVDIVAESLSVSFAQTSKTVIERLREAGETVSYADFADDADECFLVLSSAKSTDGMRSDAEETLGELTSRLDLSTDVDMLTERLTLGYLGETNYYTSYERMLSEVLGSKLDDGEKELLYSSALRASYRVFRPLFDQAYELLGDAAQGALDAYIADILKSADGSRIYFEQVYETVVGLGDGEIEEKYGLTFEETVSKFRSAFEASADRQGKVTILKKTDGVNDAFERISVFTDIFIQNGVDCLGLDTRGVFTVPETGSDPSDLVCDAEAKAFKTEYSNGEVHDNVFIIPKINIDAPGAEELNAQIYDFFLSFNEFYESLGSNVANYDWAGYNLYAAFSYDSDLNDGILTVTVTEKGAVIGGSEYTKEYVYRYDMKNDAVLSE